MRKKIVFSKTLVARVARNIQGKLTTPPLWYGALQRVPQPPAPPARAPSAPPITFELEDRLRRLVLARNPQMRDEPLDLSRGARKAVRRSTAWSFVHEWICAIEDRGLSEDDAYELVRARRAREEGEASRDVTELSLRWSQMTDEAIRRTFADASTASHKLPSNWSVSESAFNTPQPGASVLVSANVAAGSAQAQPAAGGAGGQPAQAAARPGLSELDREMRELAEYADGVVCRKLDEVERQLEALLASDGAASGAEPGAEDHVLAFLEQDVPTPKGLATDVFDLKVKRLS